MYCLRSTSCFTSKFFTKIQKIFELGAYVLGTKLVQFNYFLYLCRKTDMKTLNIAISDIEYSKFSIPSEQLSFSVFIDIVGKELMRQNFSRTVALAEKYGLSSMTMDDITNEVKALRKICKE